MKEQATITEPKLYTVNEALAVLKVSKPMLYKMMDQGKLRYAKFGTRRIITQAAIVKLIEDSMVA